MVWLVGLPLACSEVILLVGVPIHHLVIREFQHAGVPPTITHNALVSVYDITYTTGSLVALISMS